MAEGDRACILRCGLDHLSNSCNSHDARRLFDASCELRPSLCAGPFGRSCCTPCHGARRSVCTRCSRRGFARALRRRVCSSCAQLVPLHPRRHELRERVRGVDGGVRVVGQRPPLLRLRLLRVRPFSARIRGGCSLRAVCAHRVPPHLVLCALVRTTSAPSCARALRPRPHRVSTHSCARALRLLAYHVFSALERSCSVCSYGCTVRITADSRGPGFDSRGRSRISLRPRALVLCAFCTSVSFWIWVSTSISISCDLDLDLGDRDLHHPAPACARALVRFLDFDLDRDVSPSFSSAVLGCSRGLDPATERTSQTDILSRLHPRVSGSNLSHAACGSRL